MATVEPGGDPAVRSMLALRKGGPTVLRILLGAQLRRLREAKGITLEEAGHKIRASHSKMSRLELGRVGFKDRDVADLLTEYDVLDEQERDMLRALARQANAQGWWHVYSDILATWFEAYVGLEEAASTVTHRTRSSSFPACFRPKTTRARSRCSDTRTPQPRRSSGGSVCGSRASGCSG